MPVGETQRSGGEGADDDVGVGDDQAPGRSGDRGPGRENIMTTKQGQSTALRRN